MTTTIIKAPFTEFHVANINEYQRNDYTQELICEDCNEVLKATPEGLLCECCEMLVTEVDSDIALGDSCPQKIQDIRFSESDDE